MGGDKGLVGGPGPCVTPSTIRLQAPKQGASTAQHPRCHPDATTLQGERPAPYLTHTAKMETGPAPISSQILAGNHPEVGEAHPNHRPRAVP